MSGKKIILRGLFVLLALGWGCSMGFVPTGLTPAKAYGEYWTKPGMTTESWRQDWVAWGGRGNGQFSGNVPPDSSRAVSAKALADADITGPLADTLTGLASTATGAIAGAATGGNAGATAGGAAALNQVANNYLTHDEDKLRAKLRKKKAKKKCDAECERDLSILEADNKRRNAEIQGVINLCQQVSGINCEEVAKYYAKKNGYGFAAAKFENKNKDGSPLSFNGIWVVDDTKTGKGHYETPKIKQKDGSYAHDPGGLSFGMFQLSANKGGMETFLDNLREWGTYSEDAQGFYDELVKAGGLEAARRGDKAFVAKFMELNKRDPQFVEFQFESINQTAIKGVIDPMFQEDAMFQEADMTYDTLSDEAKEAIFSITVQHGQGGAKKAFKYVMSSKFSGKEYVYNKAFNEKRELLEQKFALYESKEKASGAELKKINQQLQDIDAKKQAKGGEIAGIKEWMKDADANVFSDYSREQFIKKLYDWRMSKRPTETANRLIPERDILLKMAEKEDEEASVVRRKEIRDRWLKIEEKRQNKKIPVKEDNNQESDG